MHFVTVPNGSVKLNVAVQGEGPLILCVHGWPELWYSWRHQIAHFSALGYRVAALDVRGYGGSSKPPGIEDYTLRRLASDVVEVATALARPGERTILFGHDWGAPIVWNTAVLHPKAIRAVAGLSVPFMPAGSESFIDIARALYKDRFFYQLYFQQEGVAEAEFERDFRTALRKVYFAASGDAPLNAMLALKPASAAMLDGLVDPQPFPAWMSEADLQVFVDAFNAGGFRGPLNRYRAQTLDVAELADIAGKSVEQPACFIGGAKDPVRAFVPGSDLYADPGAFCRDFRGATLLPGIGHWVQQEAPQATNAALERFVKGLS